MGEAIALVLIDLQTGCRGALRSGYAVHLAQDGHSTWPAEGRSADAIMAAETVALEAEGVALRRTTSLVELIRSSRVIDR